MSSKAAARNLNLVAEGEKASRIDPFQAANGSEYPALIWGVDLALTHSALVAVDFNSDIKEYRYCTKNKRVAGATDHGHLLGGEKDYSDDLQEYGLEYARLRRLLKNIAFLRSHMRRLQETSVVVVLEGYALSRTTGAYDMGELGGAFRLLCAEFKLKLVVVTPGTLKCFATGKGNARKEAMIRRAAECGKDWVEEVDANSQAGRDTAGDLADAHLLALFGLRLVEERRRGEVSQLCQKALWVLP